MNELKDNGIGWIFNIDQTIKKPRKRDTVKARLYYCSDCDRAWEHTGLHHRLEYYSRSDLAFYKLNQRICRGCE